MRPLASGLPRMALAVVVALARPAHSRRVTLDMGAAEDEASDGVLAHRANSSSLSAGWKALIPDTEEQCSGTGYEYIPYSTEFPEDAELTSAWEALRQSSKSGEGCLPSKGQDQAKYKRLGTMVKALIDALKGYLVNYLHIQATETEDLTVKMMVYAQGPDKGPAMVAFGDPLCQEKQQAGDERLCGAKNSPVKVLINLWDPPSTEASSSCLFFKEITDPRHIIYILVHEYYHVYQAIDCWKYDDNVHEFQASRDEFMRYKKYGFVPLMHPPGRSLAKAEYGVSWEMFAYKFAKYYRELKMDFYKKAKMGFCGEKKVTTEECKLIQKKIKDFDFDEMEEGEHEPVLPDACKKCGKEMADDEEGDADFCMGLTAFADAARPVVADPAEHKEQLAELNEQHCKVGVWQKDEEEEDQEELVMVPRKIEEPELIALAGPAKDAFAALAKFEEEFKRIFMDVCEKGVKIRDDAWGVESSWDAGQESTRAANCKP